MATGEFILRAWGGAGMVLPLYPAWRYHETLEPLLIQNTEEDEKARAQGYEEITMGMIANRKMSNWMWDIEDMSPKQLCVFAKEEYGVELPQDADQDSLAKAVMELGRFAPQHNGRIVLMAHTMQMNYEQTIGEIRDVMTTGEAEVERKEFVA